MQLTKTFYHLITISILLTSSFAYHLVNNAGDKLWSEAQTYCETTYATNLATVESEADLQRLLDMRDSSGDSTIPSWIGLNDMDVEGEMKWVSGSPCLTNNNLCVSYWKTGEPNDYNSNEDCVDIAQADFNYAGDGPCDSYVRSQFFCDEQQYHLVNNAGDKLWSEAQSYCENTYGTDLATVQSSTDLNLLINLRNKDGDSTIPSWIGLNDIDVEGEMKWVSGAACLTNDNNCVDYWKTGEPNNYNGDEDCVDIAQTGYDYAGDGPCDTYVRNQFFCDVAKPQYYWLYDASSSWLWSEAQQYCKTTYGTNLATVTTQADLDKLLIMRNMYGNSAEPTWIGLNDIDVEGEMKWISGKACELNNNLCVTYWKTGEPNDYNGNEDCVDIAQADFNYAGDGPCDSYRRMQFACDVTPGPSTPTSSPSSQPSIQPSTTPTSSPNTNNPTKQPTNAPGAQGQNTNAPTTSPIGGANQPSGCVTHSFIAVMAIVAAVIIIS